MRVVKRRIWLAGLAAALAGCASVIPQQPEPFAYTRDQFDHTDTFSRTYAAPPASACEGGRRALLSQGYALTGPSSGTSSIEGRKLFQNSPESHRDITFRIVCEPDHAKPGHSIVFVNAVEGIYTLRKTNNSASLGVGLLGSVSMPISASSDAMVQIGSETVSSAPFYQRFFSLLERHIPPVPPPPPAAEAVPVMPQAAKTDTRPRMPQAPLLVPPPPLTPLPAARPEADETADETQDTQLLDSPAATPVPVAPGPQ